MPSGRSPGAISAIYSGLDQQAALEVRQRTVSNEDNRKNELALKGRPKKEEKVIRMARRAEQKNPVDEQI